MANVALTVGAGCYNDPEDAKGLAHLCEHMVFISSKKYPKPGQFDTFITVGTYFVIIGSDVCCDNPIM
jgi:secreted Zn-dependent insulinase-like peptidase